MHPLVVILTSGLSNNVINSFLNDLMQFNVYHVEDFSDEKALIARIHSCGRDIVCISSAEACYSHLEKITSEPPKNLLGLVLFCGPHEEFYARWASTCAGVKFLSHNLKEVRRAVVWFLAGGDFSPNGEAVAPPTELKTTENMSLQSTPLPRKNYTHSMKCRQELTGSSWMMSSKTFASVDDSHPAEIIDNLAKLVAIWHFVSIGPLKYDG